MPLIGINCSKHGLLSFEEVLSGKCDCTPRFVIDSIFDISKKDYHKGNTITATSLLGCLRETYLSRKYNYYATIGQIYYSWRGTLIHSILERPNLKGWLSEKVYKKIITINNKDVEISGKLDGYEELTKTLWDIKTIGDKVIYFFFKGGAKNDHIPQVNIYRWLCPFEIERLRIIYLSMMTFIQTGQINEITQSFKYEPDKKKYKFEYLKPPKERNKSGYGKYKLYYRTPEIPVWSDEETVSFIKERAIHLINAFENNIIPPKCDKETQEWKCSAYCNMKHHCKEIEEKQNGKQKSAPRPNDLHKPT